MNTNVAASAPGEARLTRGQAAHGESILSVRNAAKSFGPVRALTDCSFELAAGEVLVLMGENGSGKSTLVKMLSGVLSPDSGEIVVGGQSVKLRSPQDARRRGIATVFQEVLTVETQTVFENVWLGSDGMFTRRGSRSEKRLLAGEALAELLGRTVDLDAPVASLSLSDRQACAIVRALFLDPRVLILDEATSALDVATRDRLLDIVRRLSVKGVSTLFISHRIDEVEVIGDRVAALRGGRLVETFDAGAWTTSQLVRAMSGDEHASEAIREQRDEQHGDTILKVEGLRLKDDSEPINLEIRAGELIGVAGLEGHGQEQFLMVLAGRLRPAAGRITAYGPDGKELVVAGPEAGEEARIAYLPRDRRTSSIFSWMPIRDNFSISTLDEDVRGGFIRRGQVNERLEQWRERLSIKYGHASDPITTLSGGNQQKVILARWLATDPRVLLLNDPTRGIDIRAKRDLYRVAIDLANQGLAVVMLSSEMDEHIELMDKVWVFREMDLFAEIDRSELSREKLVSAYFGENKAGVQ